MTDPIKGQSIRVTRLDRVGHPVDEPPFEVNPLGSFSLEATFLQPDAEVLGLLTGGVLGTPPSEPTFSLEVHYRTYVRRRAWRVVWDWLTGKPREYTDHVAFIPNARFLRNEE